MRSSTGLALSGICVYNWSQRIYIRSSWLLTIIKLHVDCASPLPRNPLSFKISEKGSTSRKGQFKEAVRWKVKMIYMLYVHHQSAASISQISKSALPKTTEIHPRPTPSPEFLIGIPTHQQVRSEI